MTIGIDLSATNSLAAVWRNGQNEPVPSALGKFLTPSVVYTDKDSIVLTEEIARDLQLIKPRNCASNFKCMIDISGALKLNGREFRAEELSSLILCQLKEDTENYLGEKVTEAVISVPIYFSDMQRKAIEAATTTAGLNIKHLINEPTAATLAHGLYDKDDEYQFLVFDLGGSTFDVSILRLFDDTMEARASVGDNFLGDEGIVGTLIDARCSRRDLPENIGRCKPALQRRLHIGTEHVKHVLSARDGAAFSVEIRRRRYCWYLATEKFELLLQAFLKRIHMSLERTIRDAKINFSQLDQVVLAGSITCMPLIRELVTRLFGRIPAMHSNPDEVVVQGAVIQAALKAQHSELQDVVATDVCPCTLGASISKSLGHTCESDYLTPVIERNRGIPYNRVRTFYMARDQQTETDFKIYQGEGRMVTDNIFLAELSANAPPKLAGDVHIGTRFTYDINGIPDVDISASLTGARNSLVTEQNPRALTIE